MLVLSSSVDPPAKGVYLLHNPTQIHLQMPVSAVSVFYHQ